MAFAGRIFWSHGPDPDRAGASLLTGRPEGLDDFSFLVQEVSIGAWGWMLQRDGESIPVQMRNGYVNAEAACDGAFDWITMFPNG